MPSLSKASSGPILDDKQIADRLYRLDSAYRSRWKMLIFLGIFVCVLGPFFFTMIIWITQFWVHSDATELPITFAWCCGVGIPLLFLLEYVTRGMFYDGPDAASPDSMGGDAPANRAGAFALMIEISLWGPRMVITGFKRLKAEAQFSKEARKAGAHLVASLLRSEDSGLDTAQAFTQLNAGDDNFSNALAYLIYHDRVNVSKDGLRLWLLSEARKRLISA